MALHPPLDIKFSAEQIERAHDFASIQEVARIEIENPKGLTGRFSVRIRLNKQGRPTCVLTAKTNQGETTVQAVADWKL